MGGWVVEMEMEQNRTEPTVKEQTVSKEPFLPPSLPSFSLLDLSALKSPQPYNTTLSQYLTSTSTSAFVSLVSLAASGKTVCPPYSTSDRYRKTVALRERDKESRYIA